ncbi:MAG: gluconate 2-dehydrogenase subunit 3 family protein [Candidatus Acidiferrum sp.]
MDRRDALKLLALGSALPAMPVELLSAFREIHEGLVAAPALKVLSPHQDSTVTTMAELIIPATDTPGAKAARVNEFIDRILADWYSEEDRTHFLAGLANVDARTQSLFQRDFADASPAQQSDILRSLGEEMSEAAAALAAAPRGYRGSSPEPEHNFYFMFRQLTLTGYFTSEAGFTLQLHEEIVPGRFDGCVPFTPSTETKGT